MLRSVIGGILMGLANLVPGISGGTMLLAAGIYPCFINAIAEVTTLRLRVATIAVLGSVVGAASVAILLFAGVAKELVVDHRWMMCEASVSVAQLKLCRPRQQLLGIVHGRTDNATDT